MGKRELDSNGHQIYYEDSFGFWVKRGYDANGNEIYYENSHGDIEDNRPKTEVQTSTVKKDAIYSIITVLQIGLQNTEELLSMHDASLGRTTPKNKSTAEQLEKEIDSIKEQIKELKEIAGK